MTDIIENLPMDKSPLTEEEREWIAPLFDPGVLESVESEPIPETFMGQLKDALVCILLFAILTQNMINELITTIIKSSRDQPIMILAVKGLIFGAAFVIYKNIKVAVG